jgi:two-component system, OmpR family, alkaline phosphatase synthesis response regulator PhoP
MAASILIVDDEPNIVLSLEFILKQAGYRVRMAPDGEAALAAVGEEPPDLLVLDAMMPKRDGFDVCGTIRANPAWAGVRILMLTAKGSDAERDKGLALGADDYLTKPFSNREVVERVRQLLAARRA